MATIKYYGVIAVKFSNEGTEHRHISHVFIIENTENGYSNTGRMYTRNEAIKIRNIAPLYTLEWSYLYAGWIKGAEIDTETVQGITYLRTVKDGKVIDNLKNSIDYDYFGKV